MKKIVIFDTAMGTSNIGDNIIMDSIERNMRDVFESGFSIRLATHLDNFSWIQMLKPNSKIKYYQNADLKFICGTNLIEQRRIKKLHHQWALYPSNASLYKNCILIGVGTAQSKGELDFWAHALYKHVLSKEYIHSVRDDLTKQIIESLGVKAINTGCPTLWELTPDKCELIPSKKSKNCVVTVSGYATQKDIVQDQKLINIIDKNYEKKYAWIQTSEDENYLNSLDNTKEIKRIYTLNQFQGVLLNGNVDYVGTRLHGGVFAMQNGCRSIIISIDHRAEGFHKSNNIPIIKRSSIDEELEERIQSDWITEIRLNTEAIREFKKQFE